MLSRKKREFLEVIRNYPCKRIYDIEILKRFYQLGKCTEEEYQEKLQEIKDVNKGDIYQVWDADIFSSCLHEAGHFCCNYFLNRNNKEYEKKNGHIDIYLNSKWKLDGSLYNLYEAYKVAKGGVTYPYEVKKSVRTFKSYDSYS